MAVLTPLEPEDARAIAAAYDLGPLGDFAGVAAGSVNTNYAISLGGTRYFVRLYEEQGMEGARAEAELLALLRAHGVPTPAPLPRRDGGAIGALRGKPAAVFPWVQGVHRCQRGVTAADARAVGEALARVHAAGAHAKAREGRFRYEDLLVRLDRIAAAGATHPDLAAQAAPLRRALEEQTARRDPSLPRGLVHGDLFRDNVLWDENGQVAALLDFESASTGVLAYDLMVTALAWCFGDALELPLVRAMIAGYESVRPLTPAERAGLVAEGCAAALRFTITRITDYAMRRTEGPRVVKDWRRFARRFEEVRALDADGLFVTRTAPR